VVGRLGDVDAHAHAASALLYGIDGTFRLRHRRTGEVLSGLRQAVVPAGCLHELACAETTMAVLLLSPGAAAHQARETARDLACGKPSRGELRPEVAEFLAGVAAGELPFHRIRREADGPMALKNEEAALDARVSASMTHFEVDPSLRSADVAQRVGLSPSRLREHYSEQLGVAPTALRTWFRHRVVIQAMARGLNLTHAAHEAGFADSAHLSRSFRKTFGLPPSRLLSTTTRFHVE